MDEKPSAAAGADEVTIALVTGAKHWPTLCRPRQHLTDGMLEAWNVWNEAKPKDNKLDSLMIDLTGESQQSLQTKTALLSRGLQVHQGPAQTTHIESPTAGLSCCPPR